MGGGGDRRKDDHNMGGRLQRVERGGETSGTGKGLKLTPIQWMLFKEEMMMMLRRRRDDDHT